MNINYDELLSEIKKEFPPIVFSFCYGSAAFPQSGYNYSQESPMLDLIFVVENYQEFHLENFKRNRHHYSGLGYYLGTSLLSFFERTFVPVHYNPDVKLSKYQIKYGVVSLKELLKNLEIWGNLVISGRMHKPIRILENKSVMYSNKITEALNFNYKNALTIAFLLQNQLIIPEKDLYTTICSISFWGDIRMILGLEKKDKIEGIIQKQQDLFRNIYTNSLEKSSFKEFIRFNEKEKQYEILNWNEARNKLIEEIPNEIGVKYTGAHKVYAEILKIKKTDEIQSHIIKTIQRMNLNYSIRLIIYHFFTTSFLKNFSYSWKKLMKRFK